jgi:hypothetical protein
MLQIHIFSVFFSLLIMLIRKEFLNKVNAIYFD